MKSMANQEIAFTRELTPQELVKQTEIFLGLGGCQMSNETKVTGCYSLYT